MNYKTKTVRQSCTSENEMNYEKLQEAILICKMKDKKPLLQTNISIPKRCKKHGEL